MYALTVIPINRNLLKEELTYFSKVNLPIGSLVEIEIRHKASPALIINSIPVASIKSTLKKSDFALKKIKRPLNHNWFTENYISASLKTADFFAVSLGQILKLNLPAIIINQPETKKTPQPITLPLSPTDNHEISAVQDILTNRLSLYRSLIREEFAKKKSVILCAPNSVHLNLLANELSRGIEQFTIIIHNQQSKKNVLNNWLKATTVNQPILIITTPTFLAIPRLDIGTIIIEEESSDDYYRFTRPFIDWRRLVEFYTEANKAKLILGDIILRPETIKRIQQKEIHPLTPLQYRLLPQIKTTIVNQKTKTSTGKKAEPESDKTLSIISHDLWQMIDLAIEKKKKIFLLVGRKGLAPITICQDCDTLVLCPTCNRPLTLHEKTKNSRWHICHSCQSVHKAFTNCTHCASWRLSPSGIGTELVAKLIKDKFPNNSVFILDKTEAPTKIKARKIVANFENSISGIMIGTDLSLRYLSQSIPYTAIVSLDALFAIPDFRLREKILRKIMKIKELTEDTLIIQTRLPKEKTFTYATVGNLADFYREELDDRQDFKYPPWSILIKITCSGPSKTVQTDITKLEQKLEQFQPVTFSDLHQKPEDQMLAHLLFKVETKNWPLSEIVHFLKSLPPRFTVTINPTSIL